MYSAYESRDFKKDRRIDQVSYARYSKGSGEINQMAPYAKHQYYEHKEKSYWFERMKNRHKDSILKGAAQYVKSR